MARRLLPFAVLRLMLLLLDAGYTVRQGENAIR
jgi:hypothetical protein